jgi:hypothetical protein
MADDELDVIGWKSSQQHEHVGRRGLREMAAEEPLFTLLLAVADPDLDEGIFS